MSVSFHSENSSSTPSFSSSSSTSSSCSSSSSSKSSFSSSSSSSHTVSAPTTRKTDKTITNVAFCSKCVTFAFPRTSENFDFDHAPNEFALIIKSKKFKEKQIALKRNGCFHVSIKNGDIVLTRVGPHDHAESKADKALALKSKWVLMPDQMGYFAINSTLVAMTGRHGHLTLDKFRALTDKIEK